MKAASKCKSIEEVRKAIDEIDAKIIQLIKLRYDYVKEIVRFKEPNAESIKAQNRYDQVVASRRRLAEKNGLDPEIIEKIYCLLMDHFISQEMKILNIKNNNKL